jgi:hypothetical protein
MKPYLAPALPQTFRVSVRPLFGAPGRIRTSDPLVRSQMLYPAELRARGVTEPFYN